VNSAGAGSDFSLTAALVIDLQQKLIFTRSSSTGRSSNKASAHGFTSLIL